MVRIFSNKPLAWLILASCGFWSGGCGELLSFVEDTHSCDLRRDGEPRAPCVERDADAPQGASSIPFGQSCETRGGTFKKTTCSENERVAGCQVGRQKNVGGGALGQDVVEWYYAPHTAEEVETYCAGIGGDYLSWEKTD